MHRSKCAQPKERKMLNALLNLCIEQPAFPATLLTMLMIAGLAVVAALEYPDPYRVRRARRRRYSRR